VRVLNFESLLYVCGREREREKRERPENREGERKTEYRGTSLTSVPPLGPP